MRTKAEVLGDLRGMLRELFTATNSGQVYARIARAHGYVDGYMRGLLETGLMTRQELLEVVGSERERVSGPAMRTILDLHEPILGSSGRTEPQAEPRADEAAA
jgi:hypothetical protein